MEEGEFCCEEENVRLFTKAFLFPLACLSGFLYNKVKFDEHEEAGLSESRSDAVKKIFSATLPVSAN